MDIGKQYILGNIMTFDLHLGVGFGVNTTRRINGNGMYYSDYSGHYGSCVFMSNDFPLILTGGLQLGFLFK